MERDFTGKVAFVTGAANGIRGAAVLEFVREGASMIVTDGQRRAALRRPYDSHTRLD